MTQREKIQPHEVFISAGHKAFHMLIDLSNNPHRFEPYRSLWAQGYTLAQKAWDKANPKPFKKKRFNNRQQAPKPQPTLNVGRIERFNKKNRTKV